ncbi:ClpP/crotonase-like domain-containing protein [Suillus ampliporus]|nr:ClpP/crotonase-like domain-containing protein [Suillus ampliporus]
MTSLGSKYIKISSPAPHVLLLELDRQPVNAFTSEFWKEYGCTFDALSTHPDDIRAVVLSSAFPKVFTAGLDFQGLMKLGGNDVTMDPARRAFLTRDLILDIQRAVAAPERCPIPVIAAVHGIVIGLGIDIISACDVRYAASDAKFSIKEVDMGLAADVGTLAHLPKITGNHSLVRELAYTGRTFSSDEAEKLGLVSRVVGGGREAVVAAALQLARDIASKSPVAVTGTKHLLLHARDHSVAENLQYTAIWNSAAVQTADLEQAVKAGMTKSKESPKFLPLRPKL